MLNVEQGESGASRPNEPFTYADYLRVPELLDLQSPLSVPLVHDEMLFIILQQIQELWFKQILFELSAIIDNLQAGQLFEAVDLIQRVNRIVKAVGEEVVIMETMPPQEFGRFRHVLTTSSGFESEQFRELEYASGLSDPTFLKLMGKYMDMEAIRSHWPITLHDAFLRLLADIDPNPVRAVAEVYSSPRKFPELYLLAEALSEYEVLFGEWRFHHVKLVERTIGDHSPGTAGSSGVGYLGKTLGYRFFPELWEARNLITDRAARKE